MDTKETRELCISRIKDGKKNREIYEELIRLGYSKSQTNLYVMCNRVRKSIRETLGAKEHEAVIRSINSVSELYERMTSFINKLETKYGDFDIEKMEETGKEIEAGYERLSVLSDKDQKKLMMAEMKFKVTQFNWKRGREAELEDKITEMFKVFAEIHKQSISEKGMINQGTVNQKLMMIAPHVQAMDERIKEAIRSQYPDTGPGNLG